MSKKQLLSAKGAAIIAVVFSTLKSTNQTTVEDVKLQTRKSYPDFYTTTADVENVINNMVNEGVLVANGDVYSDPRVEVKTSVKASKQIAELKTKNISRSKAADLIRNSKGAIFSATFIKKDRTLRTINCKLHEKGGNGELGYIKVNEIGKIKKGEPAVRNLNLQTLQQLSMHGKVLNVG